ncbi:MAG: beta-lactamase family protein [Defluviitaleaceae bacterium]|nr:beta-lactamase family protein [Defluviitaleaceae bacterium]
MDIFGRMKALNVHGLSIACFDDNGISLNKQFGVLERDTGKVVDGDSVFHACSISKMVTALCVLRLAQNGLLDLHKDVGGGITLANLLAHQGGYCDDYGGIKFAPETDFEYSDLGYSRVAEIVKEALGEDIAQIAGQLLFKPMGLKRTFFWDNLPDGLMLEECAVGHDKNGDIVPEIRMVYPNTEGAGLWTTPTELAMIAREITKHEKVMLTPYRYDEIGLGVFLTKDGFYSQGWGIGMQCKLEVNFKRQSGIVVMMNCEPGVEQDKSLIGEIIRWGESRVW